MNELLKMVNRKEKILLVDDDSDDRDLFAEALGFVDPRITIEMKKDGEELMDYLSTSRDLPDVIFLDLNMPRKNGKECLNEIRGDKKLKQIPVIIYTTSLNPVDIEETFNSGAHYFFRKPNSYEELKELLAQIIFSDLPFSLTRSKEEFVLVRKTNEAYK